MPVDRAEIGLPGEDGNRPPSSDCLLQEGDRMLAVILGKPMPLARNAEITDPTILSQL
ncbi:hypothetical protein [Streptomyces neyagawaensis]|uniref:hypothetical protein n=1 Tax=Streptomyces neyagawaensis TaxID=42238 RepID=UPI000A817F61|nr:hypothetical protein [Streptomyces neyagawaensis]MCL6734153.1 hypothetical protein [Streptomyces neyagawaensis]MDE1681087.1 hypothetical protein [Streptomyces neyagawaensis]